MNLPEFPSTAYDRRLDPPADESHHPYCPQGRGKGSRCECEKHKEADRIGAAEAAADARGDR